jgi:hypothetical protein
MARVPILSLIVAMIVSGCDDPQRTVRLEKENADLKAQLNEKKVTRNYDLEARCSKDARVWFNQNFSRDKDTMLSSFSNHYHVPSNQCYIFVEYHWRQGVGGGKCGDMRPIPRYAMERQSSSSPVIGMLSTNMRRNRYAGDEYASSCKVSLSVSSSSR